jgi:hypothetical protein
MALADQLQQFQQGRLGSSFGDYKQQVMQQAGIKQGQMNPAIRAQMEQLKYLYGKGDVNKARSLATGLKSTFTPMQQQIKANQPYARGGMDAFRQQQALLGLRGEDAMNEAYMENPAQQFARSQMEQALMRNAAATGGLGGSDIQRELADRTAAMTAGNIQNQLSQLGLMSEQGRMARGNIGEARAGQWIDSLGIQGREAEQRAAARAAGGSGFGNALGFAGTALQLGGMIPSGIAGFQQLGSMFGGGGGSANYLSGIGGSTYSPTGTTNVMAGYP